MPKVITQDDLQKAAAQLWAKYQRWAAKDLIKPGPPRGFRLTLDVSHDGGRGISGIMVERDPPDGYTN